MEHFLLILKMFPKNDIIKGNNEILLGVKKLCAK